MKFFVPHTKDNAEAEVVYEAFAKFNEAPITKKRIWKLKWKHNGEILQCEIGKPIIGDPRFENEPVLAILELSNLYFICTPNRGGVRGEPIIAGKDYNSIETYFDD
jgi:hypothetical protein